MRDGSILRHGRRWIHCQHFSDSVSFLNVALCPELMSTQSFFNMFDNHRGALLNAYDPLATFSFSANTAIPIRARIEGFHSSRDMPNQRKLEWGPWLTGGAGGSRNLNRIGGGLDKAVQSLHIGGEATVKALANLPKTRHDIGGPPEKFSLDSFPVAHGQGMGLLLTLHGQFTEGTLRIW